MTQTSYPWTGVATGDCGPYSAAQWGILERYVIGDDSANPDSGPITGSGTSPDPGLTVQQRGAGANMSVDVTAGSALVNGTFYYNDATVNLVIAANASGNPRIDTIVLNKDFVAQTIRLAVVQGTPAGTPVPPTMINNPNVQWQIPLFDVAVANGAVSITNTNITPHKNPANVADGVYVHGVLNNSGVVLTNGDVVVWDSTADRAVKTTTSANDSNVAGVWVGRTAIGGYGRVLILGIGKVNANAAVTRGQNLATSTSAKQAAPGAAGGVLYSFALALETTGGAGLVNCIVNTLNQSNIGYITIPAVGSKISTALSASSTSTTFVDVDGTNAIVTYTCKSTGRVRVIVMLPVLPPASQVVYVDTIIDSATRVSGGGASGGGMLAALNGGGNTPFLMTYEGIVTGLSLASHTFKPQWRNSGGGTMTTMAGNGVFSMFVEEF